jgi:NADPH:quinone reductase-like Zn-dependent oxidoreductase
MKAVQLFDYGSAADLTYTTLPSPEAQTGELRVIIHAAAVNPLELKLASGMMREMMPLQFPWIPGIDLSGVVDQVGEGVAGFQVGDAVYASLSGGGAYAEAITAAATLFSHKPPQLSHVEAAALAGVAQTAWQALFDEGQLEAGQRVLIHGASGGVGTLAVQLAHWKGATVLATTSQANADFVRDLGADQVLDSRDLTELAAIEPVDLVIDAVGGESQGALYPLIKPGGKLLTLSQPPSEVLAKARQVQASMVFTRPSGDGLRAFEQALSAGAVKPLVDQTFPLQDAAQAWARQSQSGVRGKLVLIP